MNKFIKIRKICKKLLLSILVIVMLVCLPSISLNSNEDLSRIYSVFLGHKSKCQGIIEIWNIDSFEGGSGAKITALNNIADRFQKKNKGIYIMVRNLTEQEVLNLINSGDFPDLFSCSFGVANKIKDYVTNFNNVNISEVDESLKKSVCVDDKIMAVPWCKGSYYLFSTKDKLQRAKVENLDDIKLSNICMSLGYIKNLKKGEKKIYSCAVGNSKYLMPLNALKSYNISGVELISNLSYNKENLSQTTYSAYCNFIADNSTILLGTQRDIFRIENRVKNGKLSDVVYEQVLGFTDLVQFMLLSKNVDSKKLEYVYKFVNFLTSQNSQKLMFDIGMLPVINVELEVNKEGSMTNITPQNFSVYNTNSLFISESEINKLQCLD